MLGQELDYLLANDGLKKILRLVRSQLQTSKEDFLNTIENRFDTFYSPDEIDDRVFPKLWKELEGMKCKYLCPWCGMPCCGTQNCNDKYVPDGLPSIDDAKVKHSCHFHRDPAIAGARELVNHQVTDRLPNQGGCPRRVEKNYRWRINDPENKDGPKIYVATTYYDTTWRIKSAEEDPDQGSGFFWQWFLSFVSNNFKRSYF